jgi:hypothetical protein
VENTVRVYCSIGDILEHIIHGTGIKFFRGGRGEGGK